MFLSGSTRSNSLPAISPVQRISLQNQVAGVGWSQGISLDYMKPLVRYWSEQYEWRPYEEYLNGFDQYLAEIDGQTIHFFHQRSPEPGAIPLLLLHGWPMGAERKTPSTSWRRACPEWDSRGPQESAAGDRAELGRRLST